MRTTLMRWIAPPVFPDEDKTRVAGLLNIVLLSMTALVAVHILLILLVFHQWLETISRPIITICLLSGLLLLLRRGLVRAATALFCLTMWMAISLVLYSGGGISNPAFAMYSIVIVAAGLLLGWRAAAGIGALSILTGLALALISENGLLPANTSGIFNNRDILAVHAFTFAALVILLVITVRSIQATLKRARTSECALAERNKSLEAEIARREQAEEAYRTLVEHSIQGLFIQQDGRIVFANQAELDMLGYSSQELMAIEDLTILVHPEDRAVAALQTVEVLNGDVSRARYEVRLLRADGEVRWMEIYPMRIMFRDRPAIQAAVIDITERKQSDGQQLELRLAREKAALLGEFIGNISHDLGTPLSVINTSLYLLERITDPQRQKVRLEAIKEQVHLLERLIQDILTSSRLDYLPLPTFRPVDLNHVLSSVIEKLRPVCEKKTITVTFSAGSPGLQVLADEHELNRAFMNLLENAVKYTPDGGLVTVRAAADGGKRLVEITDTGIGIGEDDLPHIFDRFFRASGARASGITGTGLGLSIVRQIVDMHGGTIEVTSVPKQGTTFRVWLLAPEEI